MDLALRVIYGVEILLFATLLYGYYVYRIKRRPVGRRLVIGASAVVLPLVIVCVWDAATRAQRHIHASRLATDRNRQQACAQLGQIIAERHPGGRVLVLLPSGAELGVAGADPTAAVIGPDLYGHWGTPLPLTGDWSSHEFYRPMVKALQDGWQTHANLAAVQPVAPAAELHCVDMAPMLHELERERLADIMSYYDELLANHPGTDVVVDLVGIAAAAGAARVGLPPAADAPPRPALYVGAVLGIEVAAVLLQRGVCEAISAIDGTQIQARLQGQRWQSAGAQFTILHPRNLQQHLDKLRSLGQVVTVDDTGGADALPRQHNETITGPDKVPLVPD